MSLLTSLTRANPGGADLSPLPISSSLFSGAVAWPSANRGYFVKFRVGRARLASGLRFGVGSASGNAKVALYSSDGSTLTQIAISASTGNAGANAKQDIAFITAVTISPGIDYYAFLAFDNAAATVLRATLPAAQFGIDFDLCYYKDTTFTTPPTPTQTLAGMTAGGSYVPVLYLI